MCTEASLSVPRKPANATIGTAKKDPATLRALAALVSSLPATENPDFREEFDTVRSLILQSVIYANHRVQEYEDVQLTAYLSSLTKSTNILNDVSASKFALLRSSDSHFSQLVDKHVLLTASNRDERGPPAGRRRMGRQGGALAEWDRMH